MLTKATAGGRRVTPARAIACTLAGAGVDVLFGTPDGGNNLDVIGACEHSATGR